MTPLFNSFPNATDWLKWEADNYFSRDTAIVAMGSGVLNTGTVLGQSTLGALTSAVKASGANTGTGTLTPDATTPVLTNAKPGFYTVRFTGATTFRVTDPMGSILGDGVVGTAFSDRVKFNTAAGGTAFVAGDGFDLMIAAGTGKYVPCNPTALDGSAVACAILFDRVVDTTSADQKAIIVRREAIVSHAALIWGSSITTAPQRATANGQLGSVGILVREGA